jgi:hypothetical protein
MNEEKWKKFFQKAKEDYYNIGVIPCSAFGGKPVYFNRNGFNHLIRKGRKHREQDIQIWRLKLVPYAVIALGNIKSIYQYREHTRGKSVACFWELRTKTKIMGKKIILCIILRKLCGGKLHFFSVFDR